MCESTHLLKPKASGWEKIPSMQITDRQLVKVGGGQLGQTATHWGLYAFRSILIVVPENQQTPSLVQLPEECTQAHLDKLAPNCLALLQLSCKDFKSYFKLSATQVGGKTGALYPHLLADLRSVASDLTMP